MHILFATLAASPAAAQVLTEVKFPSTKETGITDCSTPSIVNLPGGQTVTLEGGQFIHYTDANFNGTMYATSTLGGCVRMPPPIRNTSGPMVKLTFSKPVTALSVNGYNYVGDDQFLTLEPFNQYPAGALGSITGWFPSLMTPPDFPLPWSSPPPAPPIESLILLTFASTLQADKTFDPPEWAWGITSLKIPQGPPDIVKFDYAATGDDGKILISKSDTDSYASKYQTASNGSVKVRISGTLLDATTKKPKQGKVYLRVDDPADTAPYRGADAHADDNAGQRAQLDGEQDKIAAIDTGTDGKFETNLTINQDANGNFVAGDNYQIAGSTDSKLNCTGTCMKSGVFTLWKRIYVEEEHMFQAGAFLNGEAAANDVTIPIDDPTPFQGLSPGARLELVHADSGDGQGYYSDVVSFASVQQNAKGKWVINTDPSTHVPRYYGSPRSDELYPGTLSVIRDGVGIVDAGVFEPATSYVSALFQSMFIDVNSLTPDVTEIPYIGELTNATQLYYAARWLENGKLGSNGFSKATAPNVFHRMGATQFPLVLSKTGCLGAELGLTTGFPGTNASFILLKRMDDVIASSLTDPVCGAIIGREYAAAFPSRVNGEVTAHETVHFWVHSQREPTMDDSGHCVQDRYRRDGLQCLMHLPYAGPGLFDGEVLLHYEDHGNDSEYMWIRRDTDPVPLR